MVNINQIRTLKWSPLSTHFIAEWYESTMRSPKWCCLAKERGQNGFHLFGSNLFCCVIGIFPHRIFIHHLLPPMPRSTKVSFNFCWEESPKFFKVFLFFAAKNAFLRFADFCDSSEGDVENPGSQTFPRKFISGALPMPSHFQEIRPIPW